MPFTDDFNRASLGSNWETVLGTAWTIASSQYLRPGANYEESAVRVVGTFPNNQFAEVKTEVVSTAGDPPDNYGPAVRMDGSGNCYYLSLATLRKRVAGVDSYLTEGSFSFTPDTLYTIKLVATGTGLEGFVNGTSILTWTDSDLTSGNPGVHCLTGEAATIPRFDDLSSTSANVVATPRLPRHPGVILRRKDSYQKAFSKITRVPKPPAAAITPRRPRPSLFVSLRLPRTRGSGVITRFFREIRISTPRRPRPTLFVHQPRPLRTYGHGILRGNFSRFSIPIPAKTGNVLVAPFNIGETVADHFLSRGWRTVQDQINAGFPYAAQPVPESGQYVETIDYGGVLNNVIVNLDWAVSLIAGTVNVSSSIETSLDGVTWDTPIVGKSAFFVSFRYVRVTITFTGVD